MESRHQPRGFTRRLVLAGMAAGVTGARARAPAPSASAPIVLAGGLKFPEAPVAMRDGSVLMVEILGGTIDRYRPGSGPTTLASPGEGPNGLAIGPDGACYVVQNGGRIGAKGLGRVQRLDLATGALRPLYDGYAGKRFDGPNDLVFDRNGGFYFSDFAAGAVFWARADGSEVRLIDDRAVRANGVALSPDGGTLYVAHNPRRLSCYRITGEGRVAQVDGRPDARTLSEIEGDFQYDSMKAGADGDLYVAAWRGGVARLSPDGALKAMWRMPGFSITNLAFGGRDRRDLYMTGLDGAPATIAGSPITSAPAAPGATPFIMPQITGSLLRARAPSPGLRLNFS